MLNNTINGVDFTFFCRSRLGGVVLAIGMLDATYRYYIRMANW